MTVYKHQHTQHMDRMQRIRAGTEGSLADDKDDVLDMSYKHGMFIGIHCLQLCHVCCAQQVAFLLLFMHG